MNMCVNWHHLPVGFLARLLSRVVNLPGVLVHLRLFKSSCHVTFYFYAFLDQRPVDVLARVPVLKKLSG